MNTQVTNNDYLQFGKIIAAPMGGKCKKCSAHLQKGELVLMFKGGMYHEDCSNPMGILTKAKIEFANIFDYKEFDDIQTYREYAFAERDKWNSSFNHSEMREVMNPRHNWGGAEWYGVSSVDEVMAIIDHGGWEDGAKTMSDLADYIDVPPPLSIRRHRRRDRQGDTLDIHAVYAGNLERAWERPVRDGGLGRQHIVLIASMQGLGGLHARTYLWRGAACLVLSDLLTAAGYNVEIWGEYRCDFRNRHVKLKNPLVHRIRFKHGKVPIDPSSLASMICLAGFKRVIGFSAMQRHLDEYKIDSIHNGSWASMTVHERQVNEIAGFDGFNNGSDEQLRQHAKDAVVKAIERVNAYHNLTRESQE
jgi:hypothetical protein